VQRSLQRREGAMALTGSGGGTVHIRRGKVEMRSARCDSGDKVGCGSSGGLARFHCACWWALGCSVAAG
jgi:hypothetical protein